MSPGSPRAPGPAKPLRARVSWTRWEGFRSAGPADPSAAEETPPDADAKTVYAALAAEGLTRREAVKETARRLGLPAREVYKKVLDTPE